MPCVKGEFHRSSRQVLLGVVFVNPHKPPEENSEGGLIKAGMSSTHALIDTGATMSCISAQLASKIGLFPDEEIEVSGVHGQHLTNAYTATIVIPQINFIQKGMTVVEVELPSDCPYQALLGMDILCQGALHIDLSGSFVFCV